MFASRRFALRRAVARAFEASRLSSSYVPLATRGVALAVLFPRHALLQLLLRWQAAQLLKKIHIMKAQQAENERVRADKEHQRQEAMREEKERVAQLKVRDRQGEGKRRERKEQ